jgi:hypothetical protein
LIRSSCRLDHACFSGSAPRLGSPPTAPRSRRMAFRQQASPRRCTGAAPGPTRSDPFCDDSFLGFPFPGRLRLFHPPLPFVLPRPCISPSTSPPSSSRSRRRPPCGWSDPIVPSSHLSMMSGHMVDQVSAGGADGQPHHVKRTM